MKQFEILVNHLSDYYKNRTGSEHVFNIAINRAERFYWILTRLELHE